MSIAAKELDVFRKTQTPSVIQEANQIVERAHGRLVDSFIPTYQANKYLMDLEETKAYDNIRNMAGFEQLMEEIEQVKRSRRG